MSDPITADASPKYVAAHTSGARSASDIRYIVVHSTEGDTAQGAASWFVNAASGGSANMVVDDNTSFRTVADLVIPWGAPPLNKNGWHIEFAGYAHWTADDWLKHKTELDRGAYKVALRCKKYSIPVRWVGSVGLRLGRKGITRHMDVSDAWHQSTHHDPGDGFPRAVFLALVRHHLNTM